MYIVYAWWGNWKEGDGQKEMDRVREREREIEWKSKKENEMEKRGWTAGGTRWGCYILDLWWYSWNFTNEENLSLTVIKETNVVVSFFSVTHKHMWKYCKCHCLHFCIKYTSLSLSYCQCSSSSFFPIIMYFFLSACLPLLSFVHVRYAYEFLGFIFTNRWTLMRFTIAERTWFKRPQKIIFFLPFRPWRTALRSSEYYTHTYGVWCAQSNVNNK